MNNSHYYNRVNHNIAISGIFFGLALLFQFLSKFMPLVPFLMNINLSLIFIVPIFFLADYKYGLLVLVLRLAIGPAVDAGYTPQGMIGHFVLFISSLIFIGLLLGFKKIKLFNRKWGMYLGTLGSILIASLIMAALNGYIFVPWYQYVFTGRFAKYISPALGASNYWAIIFAVYITGNIINFGLAGLVLIPVLKLIKPKLKDNTKLANLM